MHLRNNDLWRIDKKNIKNHNYNIFDVLEIKT